MADNKSGPRVSTGNTPSSGPLGQSLKDQESTITPKTLGK